MARKQNFYPPVMDNDIIPFIYCRKVKVYYDMPSYNNVNDIQGIQIMVNNISTNLSCLSANEKSIKIINGTPQYDEAKGRYYFTFDPHWLEKMESDVDYKLQIRFSSIIYSGTSNKETWLNSNIESFSEWSKVVIFRAISDMNIILNELQEDYMTPLNRYLGNISGQLIFSPATEQELLASYQVSILEGKNLIMKSDMIFPYELNKILYDFNRELKNNTEYKIKVKIETSSGYIKETTFPFRTTSVGNTPMDEASVTYNKEFNRVEIKVFAPGGNYILRRNEVNYVLDNKGQLNEMEQEWEDVSYQKIKNNVPLTFYDYCITDGKKYRYALQTVNTQKIRMSMKYLSDDPLLITMDDASLSGGGRHLRINYDNEVSDFNTTILEEKVDTIGSKYPFFSRNGIVGYKEFPLNGTICFEMDKYVDVANMLKEILNNDSVITKDEPYEISQDNHLFLTDEEIKQIFQVPGDIYESDLDVYSIERLFREKAYDFLSNGKVKMYRSPTEGTLLVRLSEVNISSKQEIGRLIYSFSCTATEIDDLTMKNCDYYDIQKIGDYNTLFDNDNLEEKTILLSITPEEILDGSTGFFNLFDYVDNKIKELYAPSGYENHFLYFNSLEISFDNEKYPFEIKFGEQDSIFISNNHKYDSINFSDPIYIKYNRYATAYPKILLSVTYNQKVMDSYIKTRDISFYKRLPYPLPYEYYTDIRAKLFGDLLDNSDSTTSFRMLKKIQGVYMQKYNDTYLNDMAYNFTIKTSDSEEEQSMKWWQTQDNYYYDDEFSINKLAFNGIQHETDKDIVNNCVAAVNLEEARKTGIGISDNLPVCLPNIIEKYNHITKNNKELIDVTAGVKISNIEFIEATKGLKIKGDENLSQNIFRYSKEQRNYYEIIKDKDEWAWKVPLNIRIDTVGLVERSI